MQGLFSPGIMGNRNLNSFAAHVAIEEAGHPLRRSSDTGNCYQRAILQHFEAIVVDGDPNVIPGPGEATLELEQVVFRIEMDLRDGSDAVELRVYRGSSQRRQRHVLDITNDSPAIWRLKMRRES